MSTIKITDSVYMVGDALLTHPRDCAYYLVKGEKCVLIDCGCGEGHAKLIRNFKGLGVGPEDIACVIGTHGHYDHVSGIESLRRENPEIRLALHELDAMQVEEGDPERTCAGWMYGVEVTPQRVDVRFKGGESFEAAGLNFEIIHTPGHTPGSVCVRTEVDGKQILFAGDSLGPGNDRVGSDRRDWEETLEKALELEFDIFLPGHSSQITNPFYAALAQPFSKTLGRKAYQFAMRNFTGGVWAVSTFMYSHAAPASARMAQLAANDIVRPFKNQK